MDHRLDPTAGPLRHRHAGGTGSRGRDSGLLAGMTDEMGSPSNPEAAPDAAEAALRELQAVAGGDDEARLSVLEDLYAQLEAELERDVGEAGAARR